MTGSSPFAPSTRPKPRVGSLGRSDQRRPPRAILPPRRCTPSKRGEYTKISNIGFGSGRPGIFDGSNLNETNDLPRQKLVRVVASTSARYCRSTRSSFRFVTRSSACPMALTCASAAAASALSGSRRSPNSLTSMRAMVGCAAIVCSMKPCDSANPIWRMHFA